MFIDRLQLHSAWVVSVSSRLYTVTADCRFTKSTTESNRKMPFHSVHFSKHRVIVFNLSILPERVACDVSLVLSSSRHRDNTN